MTHARIVLTIAALSALPARADSRSPEETQALAIYKQLIETNTTESVGSTTKAADVVRRRLVAAGYPAKDITVVGEEPKHGNIVARLHGAGKRKPIILLGHLDVVEAKREDWSMDPFTFKELDGYYYGRGTGDMKDLDASWIETMIRLKEEGYKPDRDIILALTSGEEGGPFNGVQWLLQTHPDLINAAYALNEGGGGDIKNGKYVLYKIQTGEKTYADFTLSIHNKGGHSSMPQKDNAIYRLSAALVRLSQFEFPPAPNETVLSYFAHQADMQPGPVGDAMKALAKNPQDAAAIATLSKTPLFNALIHTTCVATQLAGGHAPNALPQLAKATVNCRVLPGMPVEDVKKKLIEILADDGIEVTLDRDRKVSPASPLEPEVFGAVEKLVKEFWPGVPVSPNMSTGASDGRYLRAAGIPTYGVGPYNDVDDIRWHGRDERLGVTQFFEETRFTYRLVKELSGG